MKFQKLSGAIGAAMVFGACLMATPAAMAGEKSPVKDPGGSVIAGTETFVIDGEEHTVTVGTELPPGPVTIASSEGVSEAVLESDGTISSTAPATAARGEAVALAGCSYKNWVGLAGSSWVTSPDGCSFIGLDEGVYYYYGLRVHNGGGCFQGRGYQRTYIGSGLYQRYTYWESFGCKTEGADTSGRAHWGEVASVAKVKTKPSGTSGASGSWR